VTCIPPCEASGFRTVRIVISERRQIAERFLSEGNGEAARIRCNRVPTSTKFSLRPYRQVEEIRGVADAKSHRNLREGLQPER